ncbi:tetratricopeptide repeat protein [Chitinophaga sp. GbtcB8]|uniref:tetratricopeptide repeat protein n=1 Tax=Chitinophaga sp. GbtcB8 TaxID=2824753 RepID=UPI001C2FE5DC|nr:tetratricopeptide repeat protein [Chitinophaga sp. GbtcB8]
MMRILCLLVIAVFTVQLAIAHPKDKARALYKEGLVLKRSGKLDAALKFFHAAIIQDKNYTPAYLELGQIYALMENYRQSTYYYQQISKLDSTSNVTSPEDLQVLHDLGHVYYYEGNYKAAVVLWNRMLALQPQNYFAMFMLGKSYIGSGELQKGEELCDKAVNN